MEILNRLIKKLKQNMGILPHIGDIIAVKGFPGVCIALEITEKDCRMEPTIVVNPGIYGFHGRWYGDDCMDYHSYGKAENLSPCNWILLMRNGTYPIGVVLENVR